MSKEHFWPLWAASMFPVFRDNAYREGKITITEKTIVTGRKFQERQGSVATKKIRVVCEDCNNGWMSTLEDRARPILEPLLAGNPIALNQSQQRILAEWITMKIMVAEHNTPEDVVIPRTDKETFKANHTIPAYITIWIGKHNVSGWHTGFYKHTATLSLTPNPPPSALGGRKNVETIAFGFGALFVFVMVSDAGGVDLNNFVRVMHLPQLWPEGQTPIEWGTFTLTGNAPGDIATTFERLTASPKVLWKPLPTV
jgi:hypothetical protein